MLTKAILVVFVACSGTAVAEQASLRDAVGQAMQQEAFEQDALAHAAAALQEDLELEAIGLREIEEEQAQAALLQGASTENVGRNHPICNTIDTTWWPDRLVDKSRPKISALDRECSTFNQKPNLCNDRSLRTRTTDVACTTVGANSHRCIANPCNHYNTGQCTLQQTFGQCLWFTPGMVRQVNAHWKRNNVRDPFTNRTMRLPGRHGCFRNPCNSPGYRNKPRYMCNNGIGPYKVPGVYECTWCHIRGRGMGCQMTRSETEAECAPVNQRRGSLQESVMVNVRDTRCQCANGYTFCKMDTDERAHAQGQLLFPSRTERFVPGDFVRKN